MLDFISLQPGDALLVSVDWTNIAFNTLKTRQKERHFEVHFLEWNVWIPIEISLKFVPKGPNKQYANIGSDNGLAPIRRQAIIWTNDG